MDRDQDVEVELYEENIGNLNYSTPTGSRSSSQDRFPSAYSSQEPTQRRLEENPFVAIDPRPDPEELSHAPTSQVPRIHDSCHNKSYLANDRRYRHSYYGSRIGMVRVSMRSIKWCHFQ